jgi:hypothetical protein
MASNALRELLGFSSTDLDSGVAIFFFGLVMQYGVVVDRKQGNSLYYTIFVNGAGHTDFACD